MHLIMLGPPGSGKGTMASTLSRHFRIPHISTGDIFRNNIKNETELGREAKSYIDRGQLVPDELTTAMLIDRISEADCSQGYLLDGYPRTIVQATAFSAHLAAAGEQLDVVINLELPDALVVARLSSRRLCSSCGRSYHLIDSPPKNEGICDVCGGTLIQREDDKESTVLARLKVYHEQTAPLIDYYQQRGVLFSVVNDGPVGSKFAIVIDEIEKRTGRKND
ncbi:MAG: adenylate kinase [Ruminococcaceae bacterium]|nr:adenylate kinase [Oscillospiraceae bacterium]